MSIPEETVPLEKPVRLHFPRKTPGCKDGYLSWADENTCCFLCFVRKLALQAIEVARIARDMKKERCR